MECELLWIWGLGFGRDALQVESEILQLVISKRRVGEVGGGVEQGAWWLKEWQQVLKM